MDIQATILNSLEDALGRNPIEFPFGFFLEDHLESHGGSFFWYESEHEMHRVIQNDLIDALSEGTSNDREIIKSEISKVIENYKSTSFDEDLLNSLNELLGEIDLQLQFIGSFNDLCKNKTEWSKYLREEFRELYIENIDDLSPKKLQSSIKEFERKDFAEFISEYLI